MKKRIAIYCRQSVDKKDSISVESQKERCEAFVQSKFGNTKIEVYSDKGFSGKNTDRPDFKRLFEDLENDSLMAVVVYRLDRFSRSVLDFCDLYESFRKHGVKFCSISEDFDTSTPIGEAMLKIAAVFAEMERQTIVQRVTDNYYDRIEKDGRWAGGPAPYGFTNDRTIDNIPTLRENENIEAVKMMFDAYANEANISLKKICDMLLKSGYRSSGRKNGAWDNVTVRRILMNPVYAIADERLRKYFSVQNIPCLNSRAWDGTTSCHIVGKEKKCPKLYLTNISGVIDSQTFIKVQERLSTNKQIGRANTPSRLKELAGLIKCKKCGYAVKAYSQSTNGMPYLACYGKYGLKSCDCTFHGVKFWDIQQKVGEEIQSQLSMMEEIVESENNKAVNHQKTIDKKRNDMERLLDLEDLGGKSVEVVHKKLEELQREIEELELDELMDFKILDRLKISENIPTLHYDDFSTDEKKSMCRGLIERVDLSANGDIDIVWNI